MGMGRRLRDIKENSAAGGPDSGPSAGRWLSVAAGLLLLAAGFGAALLLAGPREPAAEARGTSSSAPRDADSDRSFSPLTEPVVLARDTLARGQGLGDLLRANGMAGADQHRIIELVSQYERPRRLQPGVTMELVARVPERLSRLTLQLDRDRFVHLLPGPGDWAARLDSVPVRVDTILVGGIVETNLYDARLFGDTARLVENERWDILQRLTEIYAWQINFFRDVRSGDAFRLAIRRRIRPDGSLRSATVLAAEFFNGDRWLPAIRYVPGDGPEEYYDEEGEATRRAFLRAPLDYGRRTSGFNRNRYHPVLRRHRAHLGVDYGAPRGTAVHATGGGVVTEARRWGGYGRMVEVRHTGKYTTRYAHLAGIARGIRPGVRVEQHEVIGYVGSTGLSTAPHLHYEFLVYGRQRPPSRVDLPPGDPVPREYRSEFLRQKETRLDLLERLPFPPDARFSGRPAEARTDD